MRQSFTPYESDLQLISVLSRQVKRALQKMAFDVREGTDDEKALFDAVFSNRTKFGIEEATLLAVGFSWGDNDLNVLREDATDAQVQTCVNAIKVELIARQNTESRPVVGLAV